MPARVFIPHVLAFGTVRETGPVGWSDTSFRVDLDDGRTVLAREQYVFPADNIAVLRPTKFRTVFTTGPSAA